MANQEYLDILKQGVGAWNQWRKEHPDLLPDLMEADLTGANLTGANLTEANLYAAKLQGTDLTAADLTGANLMLANLSNAKLVETKLTKANLLVAIMEKTDMIGVDLMGARMMRANLAAANLWRASFDNATVLDDAFLGDEESGFVHLADASWGGVNLTVVDWRSVRKLGDELKAYEKKDSEGKLKIDTIRLDDYRKAVRAYRQLAVVLRDQGLNEEADYFAYRAQQLQRIVLRRRGFLSNEVQMFGGRIRPLKANLWQRLQVLSAYIFSLFLDGIAGYGYKPARTVFWYLLVVFGFAWSYFAFGHIPLLPDAFVYSLTSFHGRGFFPGLGNTTSLHNPLVVLAAAEAVTGLFIEISFIATFTQRFFGR